MKTTRRSDPTRLMTSSELYSSMHNAPKWRLTYNHQKTATTLFRNSPHDREIILFWTYNTINNESNFQGRNIATIQFLKENQNNQLSTTTTKPYWTTRLRRNSKSVTTENCYLSLFNNYHISTPIQEVTKPSRKALLERSKQSCGNRRSENTNGIQPP